MSAKGAKRPNRSPKLPARTRSEQEVTVSALGGLPRSNNLALARSEQEVTVYALGALPRPTQLKPQT
jgi:hypothetical protein